jgi:hypothetical protein
MRSVAALSCLACTLTAPVAAQECAVPIDTIPAAAWRAEFQAMRDTITTRHADAFRFTSRDQMGVLFDSLVATMDGRGVADRVMAMATWVTAVGDGHTRLLPFAQQPESVFQPGCPYPIEVGVFDDGVFVVAATHAHRDLLGSEVLRIGGRSSADVLQRLSALVPHDNRHGVLRLVPRYLVSPEVMRHIEAADASGTARWEFRDAEHGIRTVSLTPDPTDRAALVSALGREVRQFFRADSAFTSRVAGNVMVLQINQVSDAPGTPFDSMTARAIQQLDASGARRLVIDLRYNGGGSVELMRPFVAQLSERKRAGRLQDVVVLVGRGTFSAAVWSTFDLRRAVSAVTVGQPSAGRPNGFGETRWVTLPRTGLRFSYSTRWNQRSSPDDTRDAIVPDVPSPLRFADVLRGVDAALDAALALRDVAKR